MTRELLPWPRTAFGFPPSPGGSFLKKRLTSSPAMPWDPPWARATPGTVRIRSRPSPRAWSSCPAMMAWRRVDFPWALDPAMATTSLLRIPRPVMRRPLAGSSSSRGSSSSGHTKGTETPFFGPAIRWKHRRSVKLRAGREPSPMKETRPIPHSFSRASFWSREFSHPASMASPGNPVTSSSTA